MARWAVAVGALAAAAALGCQGEVLPLSAQAGSTVLIPLSGDPAAGMVGYGGTAHEDYQRGRLVYQLGGPGGFELVTRATAAALPVPNAQLSKTVAPQRQIVSLVDIPADAPVGTHTLHVVRRRSEGGVSVDYAGPPYFGELTILPHELEVDGFASSFLGAPTPFSRWLFGAFRDASDQAYVAIPLPELRIRLSADVAAAELRIEYPADVIDVFDVFEPPVFVSSDLATVWYEDDSANGVVDVGAVASTAPFRVLSLAFSLDDGSAQILDPADVRVFVEGAWSAAGTPLAVSVTSQQVH